MLSVRSGQPFINCAFEFIEELQIDESGYKDVIFDLNGQQRVIRVRDEKAEVTKVGNDCLFLNLLPGCKVSREKADQSNPSHVGAPMPGQVVEVKVKVGDTVKAGQPLAVLSAMKMETAVGAPSDGKVRK